MLRLRTALLCAGLLLLTIVAYLPLWNNDFVDFDDETHITTNRHVLEGLSSSGFTWAWTNDLGPYWQPLTWLSLQFDAHFFATRSPKGQVVLSPAVIHGENLLWHTASAVLLFGLWYRLSGARLASFVIAALFAIHPMHVESVAWAVERKDVLSVFFGILTLWAYVRYVEQPRWRRYLVLLIVYALSLLCKPMLMTLPFVLLLLDYWPLRRILRAASEDDTARTPALPAVSWRWLLMEKVPLFLLAAGIAVITTVLRERAGATAPLAVIPLAARLANAGTAYGWYVLRTFCPWDLAVVYPHPYRNWSIPSTLAGTATLLSITALCLWQARRRPWLIVGWLWFVGTLVPVIGLAQGGVQAWADRFSYWPHIGLFAAVVWTSAALVERFRVPRGVCAAGAALLLACLAVLTWIQVGYWRDTPTLWRRALAVTDDNHMAHSRMGQYYLVRGQFDRAELHCAEAVRIDPETPEYRYQLAGVLLSLGRLEEAAEQSRAALERAPRHSDAWYNLGVVRLRQGKPRQAITCFRRVLDLQPQAADALAGMGLALLREGKQQEAITAFRAALKCNPAEADAWHGLGLVHLARGQLDLAIAAFRQALRFKPQMVMAGSDLGLALGRSGERRQAVACHIAAIQAQEEGEQQLRAMNGRPPMQDSVRQIVVLYCRLGFALSQLGDRRAAFAYRLALACDPHWPRKFAARAWRLATNADDNLRDPQLACELASQANQSADGPDAALLDVLAAAWAALGRFEQAVQTAQQALALASSTADEPLARAIRERLALYKQGKPAPAGSPSPLVAR
jgi:tetratricopeptide (TPR) repeat protein